MASEKCNEDDLITFINAHSLENGSNTPDFILGPYLMQCLAALNTAINAREIWYGRGGKAPHIASQTKAAPAEEPTDPEMLTVPKRELQTLLLYLVEFFNDWKKGDFSLPELAALDAKAVEEALERYRKAAK